MTTEEAVNVATEQMVYNRSGLLLTAGDVQRAKCLAANEVYDFLMTIKNNTGNPILKIAIRAIHGAISTLRRGWGC